MTGRLRPTPPKDDRGTILPIVLIVVVVMGLVIVSLADYASTTLRYGQVVERSADRLAAANGALDNTLEAIDRKASLCALSPLANQPGGYTFELGDEINGIEPTITCRSTGITDVTGVEEFALVLTSPRSFYGDNPDGLLNDALLNVTQGGASANRKVVDGPVFMALPPNDSALDTLNFNADLLIQNGDLWYSADGGTCPDPGAESLAGLPDLEIAPAGYGIRCVADDWSTLFGSAKPIVPPLTGFHFPPAPPADTSGLCHIWEPGEYSSPPALANNSYNYFKSGDYYFSFSSSTPRWDIANAWAHFGPPTGPDPTITTFENGPTPSPHPCRLAWLDDRINTVGPTGATIYLGGPSHIDVRSRGALVVTGRDRGGRTVAIQALDVGDGDPTQRVDDTPRLVKVDSGSTSQISVEGLVWAPESSIEFRNVSNSAVAALTGGAVVGELHIGAPASATNFLVRSGDAPATVQLTITVTAISPAGGSTTVEAVIDYRDGDYGLLSRRVRCVTPETSGC